MESSETPVLYRGRTVPKGYKRCVMYQKQRRILQNRSIASNDHTGNGSHYRYYHDVQSPKIQKRNRARGGFCAPSAIENK